MDVVEVYGIKRIVFIQVEGGDSKLFTFCFPSF
jgi:hypothetical protein